MQLNKKYENATPITPSSQQAADASKIQIDKIYESSQLLAQRKFNAIQAVTDVRVVTDGLENKRRELSEVKLKERLVKLEGETHASANANMIIEAKWSDILELDIPQDLQNELKQQMIKCNAIVKSKDLLVENFQSYIREKDEEFVRVMRKQTLDISELMNRIGKECQEMQAEYENQSEVIRETYENQRKVVVDNHTDDIDNILARRKEKETYYIEEKRKREIKYTKEIDDLIARGIDEYNKLKVELEGNIQTLNQQLEEIKATYQLNSEKLEYNFRVLTELDSEKLVEREKCKRKVTKIKDQLNIIVAKYHEMEKSYSKSSNELTEDYRSLTKKYKDLQAKFKHFELADTNKYRQVWLMHQDESRELINQLIRCDQIITEQFLGLSWEQPDLKMLESYQDESLATAAVISDSIMDAKIEQLLCDETGVKTIPSSKFLNVLHSLIIDTNLLSSSIEIDSLVQHIKALLEKSSGNIPVDCAKALFVNDGIPKSNVDLLNNFYFRIYSDDVFNNDQDVENINNIVESYLQQISQQSTMIVILGNFIKLYNDINNNIQSAIKSTSSNDEEKLKQQKLKDAAIYWENLSNAVSDDNVAVWKQLQKDYHNHKIVLDKRTKSLQDVKQLANENLALKAKLNYFLGDSTVNDQFQISPVMTLKMPVKKNNRQKMFSQTLPPIATKSNCNNNLNNSKNNRQQVTAQDFNDYDRLQSHNQYDYTIKDMANLRMEFVNHIQNKKM